MVAWRYGLSLRVFNLKSHSFAALTCENTRTEIPYLRAPVYHSLYINCGWFKYGRLNLCRQRIQVRPRQPRVTTQIRHGFKRRSCAASNVTHTL